MAKKKTSTKLDGQYSSVDNFCDALETKYGSTMLLNSSVTDPNVKFVSTELPSLDFVLGGGTPEGRIFEVYGPESSGKTALCLYLAGVAQRNGGAACLVDAEYGYDPSFASFLGVDTDELKIIQPEYGEQGLNAVEDMIRANVFDVIIVDSVAALTPKAEIEGDVGDHHVGLQARMMSQALRKLQAIVGRTKTRLFFINQLRLKIGVMFGNPETTPGGNALKFYSSIRLDVRRMAWLGDKDMPTGIHQKVKVIKNKVSAPFRTTELDLVFGEGYDAVSDMFDYAVNFDIIKKAGNTYSIKGTNIGVGKQKAVDFIKGKPKLQTGLKILLAKRFGEQA